MGRRTTAGSRQARLLDDGAPPRPELPEEIRRDAITALAELLLAHLSGDAAADVEARDESEDHP